jgi:hypothetical protein
MTRATSDRFQTEKDESIVLESAFLDFRLLLEDAADKISGYRINYIPIPYGQKTTP